MTLFCTLVTGCIFLILMLVCLFFAVNGFKKNYYNAFLSQLNSVLIHLQEQDSISHQWLNQFQETGQFRLYLYDNDMPLYYQDYHDSEQEKQLLQETLDTARDVHGIDIFTPAAHQITIHQEFYLSSSSAGNYYVSAGIIPKKNGHLSFLILCSLDGLQKQIGRFRLAVCLTVLAAIFLLYLFFRYFTKRMIVPLENSQKKQTLFIASASHELRAPLAVFRSGLETLKKTKDPDEQARFISFMSEESSRMQNLISDMLILANTDSRRLPMHITACQPDELLLNIYEKYESISIKKQISLSITLPEKQLPDCICDQERTIQVFSILMDNALAYTPPGGNVKLFLSIQKSCVIFHFSDSGCGVPDNEKALIFDRFYRSEQARTNKEHFGLGLCIAKEIITAQKGQIWVEDNEKAGSIFCVKLPAKTSSV